MNKVLLGDVAVEHKETCKGSKDGYPIVGLEHLIPEEITLTAWFMMMFTLSVKTIHMVFTEMMMIALRIPLLFLKMKRVLIRKIESLS